jgi:cell division protein FtsN
MTQSPEQRDGSNAKPAKEEKSRLRDKTITITLNVPKAVFGVLFSLFVLVWVFIFGIILGRGHNPEEVVPNLAKVMPAPADPQPASALVNEVLQPRDLKYHDSLKGKDATAPPRAATPAAAPAQQQSSAQQTGQAGQQTQQKPAPTPKPAQPAKGEQQPPARQTAQPMASADQDQTVYNYIYQVAAFNNLLQAQTMQQKLQRDGVAAKVAETQTNNRTWFRVLVNFKGKQEDTRKLREKLAAYGIPNIILRDKKPAR